MPRTILAFDFGLRRIGIAVGQDVTGSASPLGVVIDRHIAEWQPNQLVVGLPLKPDGSESELLGHVRKFIAKLGRYELPISTMDERYTSTEAERLLKDARADGRRGRIDKAAIDSAAAVLIAERFLAVGS